MTSITDPFARRLSPRLSARDRQTLIKAHEHLLEGRIKQGFALMDELTTLPDVQTYETLQRCIVDTAAAVGREA
jgi:hypothetical protein